MEKSIDRYQQLINHADNFTNDRPTLKDKNSDAQVVMRLLTGEINELAEAVLGWVAAGKPEGELKIEVEQEAADVFWFLAQLVHHSLEADLYDVFMEKAALNMARYKASYFSNGLTYDQGRDAARTDWKDRNGKKDFYR